MHRRQFLRASGAGAAALVAGCSAEQVDGGGDGAGGDNGSSNGTAGGNESTGTTTGDTGDRTLRLATYSAFIDAPSSSPGAWLKETFESRVDATLEWFAPERGMNYFIQRRNQGLGLDTDAYVGLVGLNLAHIDAKLGDTTLFETTDLSSIENAGAIADRYRFDTTDRVVPFGASYVSLVYDEERVPPPETYEDLTRPEYEGGILVPNPQSSETGEMFLLMTIEAYGEDYLDYWRRLQENGVRILGSWGDAYNAYSNGEAPVVVSFSTDQVFAERFDEPMSKHQVAFPNDQGYTYIEGTAAFAGTENADLVEAFMSFMLSPEVQVEVAKRNVGLTVVENAALPDDLGALVYEPDDPVNVGYDRLSANIDTWLDEWSQQIATK
jgi:thiamine transport system substrate-binding protein